MATAYVEIPLRGKKAAGRVTLVSIEKYEIVRQHSWHIWIKEHQLRDNGPYAATCVALPGGRFTTKLMHNMIASQWGKVDHQNHDGLDNRDPNLRDGSGARNDQNRRPYLNSSSQYKGVSWHKRDKKWIARVTIDGKRKYLGRFEAEIDAARAYNDAALAAYGNQAYLNVIQAHTTSSS
jgi:AP2 domain